MDHHEGRETPGYYIGMSEPLTITAAAPLIRTGDLTPPELLEQCLRRIDVYEPAVKAWVYLDRERARQDAVKATDEIKAGNYRGPLHGIPIGIKDIIDVFDMPTGCGSKLWANSYARRDATCVERLRQAGAVILGKTVTTPYAFTDPPITRNPWNLDRTPGGSSSGSAAAVACGMCLAALGTQTGGSLTRPASYCGVCSLKPTYCRVSVDGVLPLAPSLDHVGVMANCVRDLAVVFEVLNNSSDPFSSTDYEALLERGSPADDLGFVRGPFAAHADEPMSELLAALRSRLPNSAPFPVGCEDVALPPLFHDVHERHYAMMSLGAAGVHRGRIRRRPEEYPPNIAKLVHDAEQFSGMVGAEAWNHRTDLRDEMSHRIRCRPLLITPAAPGVAPTPETTGSPVMNSPWSYIGLPTITLPAGEFDDLPLGVQLVAEEGGEERLFRAGMWMERIFSDDGSFVRRLPPVPAV
jgi:aspartyl-tRNA(Asn)/glutamyl-tRNA(Gln) amidotransferase subunit A